MRRSLGVVAGLSLVLACGGPNAASPTTASPTIASPTGLSGIRWSETAAPPGVDVPGAQWLKIEGAGGKNNSVQIAAVLRPPGPGPAPLVVWLHGAGPGFVADEVSAATHLLAGGFIVLAGCWMVSSAEPVIRDGISLPRVPCLQNYASADDAIQALVDVGQQLPGVKKGPIGLFGVSFGGPQAIHYAGISSTIGAVVLDSSPRGQTKVSVPVLMLVGTADSLVSADEQRTYEQALRGSGAVVESHYYEGGMHALSVHGDFQEDAFKRTIDFYQRYLK